MNYKDAEEIVELHKHLEKPMQDPVFQTELKLAVYSYMRAKGYLEAHTKAQKLVEALENLIFLASITRRNYEVEGKDLMAKNAEKQINKAKSFLDQWHKENKEGE